MQKIIAALVGGVDHGKTKIYQKIISLDKSNHGRAINEVGAITQEIRVNVIKHSIKSVEPIKMRPRMRDAYLVLIDTPGHQMFHNLHRRGADIADVVYFIIDITKGVDPLTISNIQKFIKLGTKIYVIINKIDKYLKQYDTAKLRIKTISEKICNGTGLQLLHYSKKSSGDSIPFYLTSAITGAGLDALVNNTIKNSILQEKKPKFKAYAMGFLSRPVHVLRVILLSGKITKGDTLYGKNHHKIKIERIYKREYGHYRSVDQTYEQDAIIYVEGPGTKSMMPGVRLYDTKIVGDKKNKNISIKNGLVIKSDSWGRLESLENALIKAGHVVGYATLSPITNLDEIIASKNKSPANRVILEYGKKKSRLKSTANKHFYNNNLIKLIDEFNDWIKDGTTIKLKELQKSLEPMIYPTKIKIHPHAIFNRNSRKNQYVIGMTVEIGFLKIGQDYINTQAQKFKILSAQQNGAAVSEVGAGQEVAIKIETIFTIEQICKNPEYHLDISKNFKAAKKISKIWPPKIVKYLKNFYDIFQGQA